MKCFISYVLIILLLSDCKKEPNKKTDCKLEQTNIYNGTSLTNSYKYEYDAARRIKKITDLKSNIITEYFYYQDSIVALSSISKEIYFLTNGVADSCRITLLNSPIGLKYAIRYQRNSEGYFINQREIKTQIQNGNLVVDTSFIIYTFTNGNLEKVLYTPSGEELRFEYSNQLRPANNPDLPPGSSKFPFIWKAPKNLISKTFRNGGLLDTVTYETDNDGNIIRCLFTHASPILPYSMDYTLSCN